ncbi:MAG: hypothetical protein HY682_08140 [Chloroflexi bacterium]|nr:hypothetical protein [Chloroflexota bacterium]
MTDSEAAEDKKDRSVRRRATEVFLVPGADAFDTSRLRELSAALPSCLANPAAAFLSNVDASVSVLCLPTCLAMASAQEWRFRQIHIAERIRAGTDPSADPNSPEERGARDKARERFAAEMSSNDAISHIADQACSFLLSQHAQQHVADAAAELLLQGVVLVWSAFEVLVRDVFEAVVNARPEFGRALLESADGRRLLEVKAIDLDTLARHSFDLSRCLGSVLSEFRDLSDLAAIRGVLGSLFQTAEPLRALLSSKDLWVLGQQRHLIVHNRGVVDRRYIEQTGLAGKEGTRLRVLPTDIERYVDLVRDAGYALLTAAQDTLASNGDGR